MLRKTRNVIAGLLIAATPLIGLLNPSIALAASGSCTWSGGGTDYKFSTAANWGAGCSGTGGIPGAGDIITIGNTTTVGLGLTDDLSGVSLGGINFTGTKSILVTATSNQTLTGNVTSTNTDSYVTYLDGPITLGADVTFTNVSLGSFNSDSLALGGHALTMKTNQNYTTLSIDQNIVGAGTLNIDISTNALFMDGTNTYSGATNIISDSDTTNSAANSSTMFGTSSINVASDATLSIHAPNSLTFSNPITFQAATKNANVYGDQLIVWNDSSSSTPVNVNLPAVTLLGNTRLGTNNTSSQVIRVNLAGITSNGYCVQYGDENNSDAGNWQNGPAACTIVAAKTPVPGTPDTGFAAIPSHPAITLSVTVLAAGSIFIMAKKMRPATVRVNSRSKTTRRRK